jgi:putative membrane protein
MIRLIPLGIAFCLLAEIAFAESEKTSITTAEFVQRAGAAGAAEVELGKLALQKSGSQAVKAFSEQMVADHQKANGELMAIASKTGMTVPASPDPVQKAALDKLRSESGAAFDRAYATRMVQDHQDAVTLFEKAANQPDIQPAVQQFAKATLPTLKAHLEHAKQLHSALGADARQSAS